MKSKPNNTTKQGKGRFAMIPETVLLSNAYRALTEAELRVYIALALHANKSRECFPSTKTLADVAGVDKSTVRKATNRMVDLGLVAKHLGGGRKRTNRYRLYDDPDGTSKPGQETENPGQAAGVSTAPNPGDVAGVSSLNPGEMIPKPRPPRRGNIHEQTCMDGDVGTSRVDAVRCALSDAGIIGPNLDRLAGLGDLTVDDVEALAAIAKDRATQNPAGLLVKMIDADQRPADIEHARVNEGPDATKPSRPEDVQAIFADYAAQAGS